MRATARGWCARLGVLGLALVTAVAPAQASESRTGLAPLRAAGLPLVAWGPAWILDLFAGSGGLGLEALSRYAEQVTLIEMDRGAADQLKKNLTTLGSSQGQVIQADAVSWLQGPATPFDLVFLDPPFRRELLPQVCELLEQRGWLAPDALIYLEREKEMSDLPLPASWKQLKDKHAGQVCYQLYLRDDAAV